METAGRLIMRSVKNELFGLREIVSLINVKRYSTMAGTRVHVFKSEEPLQLLFPVTRAVKLMGTFCMTVLESATYA
jgi:hypothetical protein